MDWIHRQQIDRYAKLIEALQKSEPPEDKECQSCMSLIKDAVICLLEGQKLQLMAMKTRFSWPMAFTAISGVIAFCITLVRLVG